MVTEYMNMDEVVAMAEDGSPEAKNKDIKSSSRISIRTKGERGEESG
jgi:hypothetical protein